MFRVRDKAGRRACGSLSIWDPVHLGIDERARPIRVGLAERNLLAAGEPGAGKSVGLNLIVAHAALSLDCRLILVDGKRVELGLWRHCADAFIGPSIVDAIDLLKQLQAAMDSRYDELLDTGRRKITRESRQPAMLVVFDELAYFSATVGESKQQKEFIALVRDLVARGRAAGIIVVAATQRPSADIIPPHCETCSDTGGHSAAPLTPAPTSSSATAGPTTDTPPPASTPPLGVSDGSSPKAAPHDE
ncbi:MAG: FtsK/SpoIIIE domain-containing protein [Pseudonocardiaceae bacterium]